MAEERVGEKIYPPFPQTIEEAQSRGHIAKSAYLTTAILIFMTGVYFKFFGHDLVVNLTGAINNYMSKIYEAQRYEDILDCMKTIFSFISAVFPLLLMLFILAI